MIGTRDQNIRASVLFSGKYMNCQPASHCPLASVVQNFSSVGKFRFKNCSGMPARSLRRGGCSGFRRKSWYLTYEYPDGICATSSIMAVSPSAVPTEIASMIAKIPATMWFWYFSSIIFCLCFIYLCLYYTTTKESYPQPFYEVCLCGIIQEEKNKT